MGRYRAAPVAGLPRFSGGLAGVFGYDVVRHVEKRLAGRVPRERSALDAVPDILLLLTDELAVVDNLAGRISLIVYADPAQPRAYEAARGAPRRASPPAARAGGDPVPDRDGDHDAAQSETGEEAFKLAVARAKEYIAAGDIMQVVLSQRIALPFAEPPLSLYRALRTLNPSPYMFYYDFGDFHVVGASPEILVRKEGSDITLRAAGGHAVAGRDARGRREAGAGAARRPQGDRRARHAARPRPQRRGPGGGDGNRAGHREDGHRALLARDAHRLATSRAR